jgi:hypothetical protein
MPVAELPVFLRAVRFGFPSSFSALELHPLLELNGVALGLDHSDSAGARRLGGISNDAAKAARKHHGWKTSYLG